MNAVTKLNTQPQDAGSTQGKVGHHNVTRWKKEVSGVVHSARSCVICQHKSVLENVLRDTFLPWHGSAGFVCSVSFAAAPHIVYSLTFIHFRDCLQMFLKLFHCVQPSCLEEMFLKQCCLDCSKSGALGGALCVTNSSRRCRLPRPLPLPLPFAARPLMATCDFAAWPFRRRCLRSVAVIGK